MSWRGVVRGRARDVTAFLRPLPDEGYDALQPPTLPEGRVVNVPGRGETFVREAPGPPGAPAVVLLHGWTLSADLNWFSGGYEVAARHGPMVAPDMRGHGRGLRSGEPFTLQAAADDVAGLIRELGLDRVVLVGYSMGASIALILATIRPRAVTGLVLASSGLQWRASFRERVLWAGMAGVEYVLRFGAPEGITDRYLRRAVEQADYLDPHRSWLKAEVRRGDPVDIAAAGRELACFDARGMVEAIDVPTAVVVTCHDHLIRAEKQRQLARAIRESRTFEVDGAHNAWMVKPREWCAALDDGLRFVLERAGAVSGRGWGPAQGVEAGSSEPLAARGSPPLAITSL